MGTGDGADPAIAVHPARTDGAGGGPCETRRRQTCGDGGARADHYGICSTDFLEHAFRTDSYRLEITFNADGSWSYVSETMLKVRGQDALFPHRDVNTLVKIAEPRPNPLMLLQGGKQKA